MVRIFLSNNDIKFVCNVGCCYHHLYEEFYTNPYMSPQEVNDRQTNPRFPLSKVWSLSFENVLIEVEFITRKLELKSLRFSYSSRKKSRTFMNAQKERKRNKIRNSDRASLTVSKREKVWTGQKCSHGRGPAHGQTPCKLTSKFYYLFS